MATAPAAPACPTLDEVTAALEPLKARVKGMIVLVGPPAKVPVTLNPPSTRADDEEMRRRFDLDNPALRPSGTPRPRRRRIRAASPPTSSRRSSTSSWS